MNKKGFTIIELLVVIVVIGILASIVVVSYTGVRERAQAAAIQSELNNTQTKLALYYAENSDTYPESISSLGLTSNTNNTYTYYATSSGYCVGITNSASNTSYHISSSASGEIESGACPNVWVQISPGGSHSCALGSNSKAYCWGTGTNGQLGNNGIANSLTPVAVKSDGVLNGLTIKYIDAGNDFSCLLASDNNAYCWGYDSVGQLGDNNASQRNAPVAVSKENGVSALYGRTIKSISVGSFYACAIADDDKAYCWGDNSEGQLGDGTQTNRIVPVAVSGGLTFKSISAGYQHTCAITITNLAYCWGNNANFELGNNDAGGSRKLVPTAVYSSGLLSGKSISAISAGYFNSCALDSSGVAYCWGYGTGGGVGNSSTSHAMAPALVSGGRTYTDISTGPYVSCAISSVKKAYCWGYNDHGDVGNNSTSRVTYPVEVYTAGVLGVKTVKDIITESYSSCLITYSQETFCWGYNPNGKLGNGLTAQSLVPVTTNMTIP